MTPPSGPGPQDAAPGQPWPAWPPPPDTSPDPGASPVGAGPGPQHLGPVGPNWALAAVGLLLLAVAGGQLAYLLGYRMGTGLQLGPQALIAAGAVLVLVGVVGSIGRRSGAATRRRRRATRCR